MSDEALIQLANQPKWMTWTGYVLTALVALFMVMDFVMKFMQPPIVISTTESLGWSASKVVLLGAILLSCTALYVIPQTSVLGAILVTGYLGGAVATHIRIDSPLFSHILFGVYLGVMMWGGLWLREPRLRALFPLKR
jgi:hypothetical protein